MLEMPSSFQDHITLAVQRSVYKSKKIHSNNNNNNLDSRISLSSSKVLETKFVFNTYRSSANQKSNFMKKCNPLTQKSVLKSSQHYTKAEENGSNDSLYPKSLVNTWRQGQRDKIGLKNLGNTCYVNSTLQALFHIPCFFNWLLSDEHCKQSKKPIECGCINCAVCKTLKLYFSSPNSFISPSAVIIKLNYISRNSFTLGRQEDAHEFLRLLLEKMDQDYLEKHFGKERVAKFSPSLKFTTPINKIFGGMMRTTVKCNSCHDTSTTLNPFLDLSLDIARTRSIQDALSLFFDVESVDYHCIKCQTRGPAQKQFLIKSVPKLLCLHLKRFHNNHSKFNGSIPFAQVLDLSKYVIKSSLHNNNSLSTNRKLAYTFVASINHNGQNLSSGHYTTYAVTANNKIAVFDDEQVDNFHSSPTNIERDMYVLFYQCEEMFSPKTQNTSNGHHMMSKNSDMSVHTFNGKRKNDTTTMTPSTKVILNGTKRPFSSLDLLAHQYGNEKCRRIYTDKSESSRQEEENKSIVTFPSIDFANGDRSKWEKRENLKKQINEHRRLIQSNYRWSHKKKN